MNKLFLLFILCWNAPLISFSQVMTDGPRNPTLFTNDASVGTISWNTPPNVEFPDNLYSSSSSMVGILSTVNSNYLVETGYGFTVPGTASICGIQVDVKRRQQGVIVGSSVKDNTFKLVKAGSVTGTEHASGTAWPGSNTYISYGGSGDLWGTAWTPADVNAPDFGAAHASSLSAGLAALFLTAEVDHIQITVYYTNTILPIELSEFSAVSQSKTVQLKWATASETNNHYFTIERSADGQNFEAIGTVNGAGNASQLLHYFYTDNKPYEGLSYYRLKQTDFNDHEKYFQAVSVECNFNRTHFFPNPSTGKFTIDASGDLTIYDLNGSKVYSRSNISGRTQIDLQGQPNGIYFYQLRSPDEVIVSGKLVIE